MKYKLLFICLVHALSLTAETTPNPNDMSLDAPEQLFYDKLSEASKVQFKLMKQRQRAMAMQLAEKSSPDKGVDVVVKMNSKQR